LFFEESQLSRFSLKQGRGEPTFRLYKLHQGSEGRFPMAYVGSRRESSHVRAPDSGFQTPGSGFQITWQGFPATWQRFPDHLIPEHLTVVTRHLAEVEKNHRQGKADI